MSDAKTKRRAPKPISAPETSAAGDQDRAVTKANAEAVGLKPPGPRTAKAIEDAKARQAQRPIRPKILQDISDEQVLKSGPTHSDVEGWYDHLGDAFGTTSEDSSNQAMVRLLTIVAGKTRAPTQTETNAALAMMAAIAPRDELEAAIGEQIVACHVSSMDFLNRARRNAGEYRDSAAAYTSMATKVSRTMATHIETLARLRSGGRQTHEVRYVYVNGPAVIGDGTQAVFGSLGAHGGGGECGKRPQSQAQIGHEPSSCIAPLWSEDASRPALQRAEGEGSTPMSDAWGESGSPLREGERPLQARSQDEGIAGSSRPGARRADVG